MKQEPFIIERIYNAPVEKVWHAITDKAAMKEWYFDVSDFSPEPGFEFTFDGTDNDGKIMTHVCKVIEVIKNRKLSYTWAYTQYEGSSLLTFELIPEGNKTKLRLTHEGLETFPSHLPSFARSSFEAGWTEITGKLLKEFVEK